MEKMILEQTEKSTKKFSASSIPGVIQNMDLRERDVRAVRMVEMLKMN